MYDLIIVGAGPAGIFTALELLRKSSTPHKILLVEKGKPVEKRHCPKDKTGVCVNCKPTCAIPTGFSGADWAGLRQRRVEFDDVRFAGTSFFRASLNGVDLSSCRLADIVLSDTMEELRGCSMDLFQAAGIARRLGVNVKD